MIQTLKNYFLIFLACFITHLAVSNENDKHARYIVKYSGLKSASVQNSIAQSLSRSGREVLNYNDLKTNNEMFALLVLDSAISYAQIKDFTKTIDAIEYIEPDFSGEGAGELIPNDAYFSSQWSLQNNKDADIDVENAWGITTGDSTTVVAILDTGCKLDHPEFQGRIWQNKDEVPDNNIDDDNNGYIDDVNGWDFTNNDKTPTDDHGHGTNVTGIIGANGNNSTGISGINWKCKLMILKGLDNKNNGYYSQWIEGIYYAVNNGANLINLSLGGSDYSKSLQEAIDYAWNKNVTVVVSMMNTNDEVPYYPAAFANCIAVGATNQFDERAVPFCWGGGSCYGSYIDLVAPGEKIISTNYQYNNDYSYYFCGTSQAAPHVTGVASLIKTIKKDATSAEIRTILETTADDLIGKSSEDTQGWDKYYGYGRLNAGRALQSVKTSNSINHLYSVQVYPNPVSANDFVSVDLPFSARQSNTVLKAIDMSGRIFYPEIDSFNQGSIKFRVKLNVGLYCLYIETSGMNYYFKLVVR